MKNFFKVIGMSERLRVARDGLVIYLGIRDWWNGKCLLPKESDKLWDQVQNYPFQKKKKRGRFILLGLKNQSPPYPHQVKISHFLGST